MTRGEAIIDIMNEMDYDVAIPGNHEFDYGMDHFLGLVEKANFPFISCNFEHEGELVFKPYIIKEVAGKSIAFVGVTTPMTLITSTPANFKNEAGEFVYGFKQDQTGEKLYSAVQEAVDAARAEGADYVYVLGHMGNDSVCKPYTFEDVISHTNGIDVFIDGHSHDTEQLIVPNKDGDGVPRTACGTKMQNIGYSIIRADGTIETGLITWNNSSFSVIDLFNFDNKALFASLSKVSNDNVQGEYYLPDVIEILKNEGHIVSAYQTEHFDETLGVNDRVALSQAEIIMKNRINRKNMVNGVTIIDPSNTYISADAIIGSDTVLHPGTIIEGNTVIGSDCEIGPHTVIRDSEIGDRTTIRQSTVHDSKLGTEVSVGPFAHIRPDSVIGDEVRVGNFVEIKKTVFGNRSKASHLSYIGDAQVGEDVNLGCGSITVNYDGKNKFKTVIGNGVFIGCNSNLVAPVTVEDGAYVAAGSTITENVPSKALSVARARQVNKEDYVDQFLNKKKS